MTTPAPGGDEDNEGGKATPQPQMGWMNRMNGMNGRMNGMNQMNGRMNGMGQMGGMGGMRRMGGMNQGFGNRGPPSQGFQRGFPQFPPQQMPYGPYQRNFPFPRGGPQMGRRMGTTPAPDEDSEGGPATHNPQMGGWMNGMGRGMQRGGFQQQRQFNGNQRFPSPGSQRFPGWGGPGGPGGFGGFRGPMVTPAPPEND